MPFYEEFSSGAKVLLRVLVLLFLIGLVLSAFAFAWSYLVSAWNASYNTPSVRQINVMGEGKAIVRPDIAVFTAGVVTQGTKVKSIQDENSSKSNLIVDFLKEQGVEEKDIKTVGYFIVPRQEYSRKPSPPKIIGYEVRHILEVKVRDLSKMDVLLSGVVDKGANEVSSISFKVEEENKVKEEARKKAIEDAKAKADILAGDLGIKLGRVTGFWESGEPIPYFKNESFGIGGGGAAPAIPVPQIQSGEQEVRSNVTVIYEFR